MAIWAIHWILPPRSFQYFLRIRRVLPSRRRMVVLMPFCSQIARVSQTFSSVKYFLSSVET